MQEIRYSCKMDFTQHIPLRELLSESSLERVNELLTLITKKKDELLIRDSALEPHAYIVQKGILREFINIDGKEITFWFAKEGDIITSTYGYFYNKKGYENFQALEDVNLLRIDIPGMHKLYQELIDVSNWSRIITEKEGILSEERHLDYILLTPEERYLKLINTQPELFQRVKLKEVASYIGISPVSLSRIRARISSPKTP